MAVVSNEFWDITSAPTAAGPVYVGQEPSALFLVLYITKKSVISMRNLHELVSLYVVGKHPDGSKSGVMARQEERW